MYVLATEKPAMWGIYIPCPSLFFMPPPQPSFSSSSSRQAGMLAGALFAPVMLGVAVLVLLLVLGYAWFVLARRRRVVFPPTQALCPDQWQRLSDGRCSCVGDDANAGTLSTSERTIDPSAMRSRAERRAWAQTYRVQWDGVTNADTGSDVQW